MSLLQSLFGGGNAQGVKVQTITGSSAMQFYQDKETVFVDVRGHDEIRSSGGTVKGAIIAPLPEIDRHAQSDGSGALPAVAEEKLVILVCASGMRSNAAAKRLCSLGYANVANLRGGIGSWVQAGGKLY